LKKIWAVLEFYFLPDNGQIIKGGKISILTKILHSGKFLMLEKKSGSSGNLIQSDHFGQIIKGQMIIGFYKIFIHAQKFWAFWEKAQCSKNLGNFGIFMLPNHNFILPINNTLFISVTILRDLLQQEEPKGIVLGELPKFLYVPTFPCKYFFSTKRERREEIKRELFTEGKVPVLVRSPKAQEHPGAHPQENTLVQNLPYNKMWSQTRFETNYSSCTVRSSQNICSSGGGAQEKGKTR
jgi:hypothetical protein